jgi:hypothetical protein
MLTSCFQAAFLHCLKIFFNPQQSFVLKYYQFLVEYEFWIGAKTLDLSHKFCLSFPHSEWLHGFKSRDLGGRSSEVFNQLPNTSSNIVSETFAL